MKSRCIECDRDKFREAKTTRKPVLYRCYNGLYEMFMPLFIEDSLAGYLHFGQVRTEQDFKTIAKECSLQRHSRIRDLEASYNAMDIIEKEKLILIYELFRHFSDTILKNRLIELKKARPEYYLKRYVEENLDRHIDITSAAGFVGRSPSFVTHKFKETYGLSFHEYLNRKRIDRAKDLLRKNPILETYHQCGFSNRYHFSKVFKRITGLTPREYQLTRVEEPSTG
jgi:AraC-like DNA-binding protein